MHLELQLGQMGLGEFYRDNATSIAPLYAKDQYLKELRAKYCLIT